MSARRPFLVVALFFVTCHSAVAAAEAKPDSITVNEFAFFRFDWGLFGRVPTAEVTISRDGAGMIVLIRRNGSTERVPLNLNAAEMATLMVLSEAADFRSLEAGKPSYTDSGVCTLRISTEQWRHELKYDRFLPRLRELSDLLVGFVYQGLAISELRQSRRAYFTRSILVSPDRGGDWLHAPQPQTFKMPLMEFIRTCESQEELACAIQALAWIAEPTEWLGFMSNELDRSSESHWVSIIRALIPHCAGLPEPHQACVLPLLLRTLRREYPDWKKFPGEKKTACGTMLWLLGEKRYALAMPTLLAMIPYLCDDHLSDGWLRSAISSFGNDAITPLCSRLDDPSPGVRVFAAATLGRILTTPATRFAEEERAIILNRLRQDVAPRLEELVTGDSNYTVQQSVKRSLEQFERGWNR